VLLYLVRHAQSRANADSLCRDVDCELTDLGCRQAELVAAELSGTTFTQVLASPYRRTVATARAIAAAGGAPLALLPSGHEHHGIAPADWIPPTRAELLWRYPDLPLVGDVPETTWHQLPESYEATRLLIGNASLTILDLATLPARLDVLGRSNYLNVAEPALR